MNRSKGMLQCCLPWKDTAMALSRRMSDTPKAMIFVDVAASCMPSGAVNVLTPG